MTKAALLSEIMQLGPDERLDLVEEVLDTLPELYDDLAITPEQIAEIRRRLAAYKADPTRGSSWEDVEARLRSRFGT